MGVPVASKSKAHPKKSGPPCNGPAAGGSHIKSGGRTFVGGGGGKRGSGSLEGAAAPAWVVGEIPDQTDADADQPVALSVAQYLVKDPYTVTFALDTPPTGFTINASGKITVDGAAVSAHSITVAATNPHGTTNDTFTWTITA